MKKLLLASAIASLTLTSAYAADAQFAMPHEVAASVIEIKKPEIIAEKNGKKSTEDYMVLVNNGKEQHDLIAATSPVAKIVQLHEGCVDANIPDRDMMQVPVIKIKPKSDDVLQPGGFHVMLIDTKKTLKPGEEIPVTLIFEDGSHITTKTRVLASDKNETVLHATTQCTEYSYPQ